MELGADTFEYAGARSFPGSHRSFSLEYLGLSFGQLYLERFLTEILPRMKLRPWVSFLQ